MARPVIFGDYHFKTKIAATNEARQRVNKYKIGDKLNDDDEIFFESLFTLHSEYTKKIGTGIDYIYVKQDFYNNKCLYIHRIDDTEVDCSWVHCIQPASTKIVVSLAFRRAIKERIIAFKTQKLMEISSCPILGIPLNKDNSHVSYANPSFEKLLKDFLELQNITFESVDLINPKPSDDDQRGIIKNLDIKRKWQTFHSENASLELISAKANLRRIKSQ